MYAFRFHFFFLTYLPTFLNWKQSFLFEKLSKLYTFSFKISSYFPGLDDKRTVPSTYEPPPTPVRFNRNRESKDREILNQYSSPTSPTTTTTSGFSTGSWRRNSTKSTNSQNSSTAPHSPIPTRFENNKSSENNHYSRNTVSQNLLKKSAILRS